MSESVKEEREEVRTILSESLNEAGFRPLNSTRWYGNEEGGKTSAASSLSCLSLPPPSKIPLPKTSQSSGRNSLKDLSNHDAQPKVVATTTTTTNTTAKKGPPVPPKPKLNLRRESSLPVKSPASSGRSTPVFWRPPKAPKMRREASFDGANSVCSLRSASGSRIPVWRGSQEKLISQQPRSLSFVRSAAKKWDSCSEVGRDIVYSYIRTRNNNIPHALITSGVFHSRRIAKVECFLGVE